MKLDLTTAKPPFRALGDSVLYVREKVAGLDPETTTIRAVSAFLVIGVASLLIIEPAATRNTDSRAERVARLAPVGSVTVAASTPAPQAIAPDQTTTVSNDS
jgi:hypothetical protein